MFYNQNDNILIPRLPKNLIKSDGTVFINFNISDANTLADYGYYTVRNDNSSPPSQQHSEDISKREIVLDKPYVDINRVWIIDN